MPPEDLVTVRLSARRAAALERIIDMQLACEDAGFGPSDPQPTALERDVAMFGTRRPIQDGDGVLYPIACRRNVLAQRNEEELGGCRWVADEGIPGSVACTTCGKAECPGMARAAELRSMVDGTYSPNATKDPDYHAARKAELRSVIDNEQKLGPRVAFASRDAIVSMLSEDLDVQELPDRSSAADIGRVSYLLALTHSEVDRVYTAVRRERLLTKARARLVAIAADEIMAIMRERGS